MIIFDKDKQCFTSTLINDEVFFSVFSTKEQKDGRNFHNIFEYLQHKNISYDALVVPKQIHLTAIATVAKPLKGKLAAFDETDGVVAKENGLVLSVISADCVPILYADKIAGVIGASHQGWRGSMNRLPQKMVEKMIRLGAQKARIIVAMGPAIGGCCYDIDEDRYFQFRDAFDDYTGKIFHHHDGKWFLNLSQLNYLLLTEAGIKSENIDFFPFCTRCDKKRFFSFRRDSREDYGEMFSLILKKVPASNLQT